MTRSTIDDRAVGDIFPVMNEHRPDLHEREECKVSELLEGKDEREGMIRKRLHEPIDWVEGHRCIRRWHYPFVVRLVEMFVDQRMVQASVDKVDPEVSEDQEEWKLSPIIPPTPRRVREGIVELGKAPHFGQEERSREYGYPGHSIHRLLDFHANLILKKLGVFECRLVENEDV